MTTPAKNLNQVLTRPGHLKTQGYNASGQPVGSETDSVLRLVEFSWTNEVRPASGSTQFQGKFGWRPCRGWTHSGRYWYYPENVVTRWLNNGGNRSRQLYENGSFWGIIPPAAPAFPAGLINQAEVKALNRLKDQDFNLGQFLAEFSETERMIAGRILQIARSVTRYRRKVSRGVWSGIRAHEGGGTLDFVRKKIPASWLELQYGWRPLMSDVFGAIQYLSKPDRLPLIHVKGYAESKQRIPVTINPVAGTSRCTATVEARQQCWVSLYYRLNSPGLATQSQLGLLNPLELVWECIPYSFVVDWFLPIGPWMSALTADAGFLFQGGSCSRKTSLQDFRVETVQFENIQTGSSSVATSGGTPSLEGVLNDFVRTCYTASPVPGLYVKSPLSALHVTNAIALLVQAFR